MLNCGYKQINVLVVALVVNLAGCGGDPIAKYNPTPVVARDALQTALATWQSGTPHGTIEGSKPAINVFDLRWQQGKKLVKFDITEELTGQEHPTFKVKTQIDAQHEETDTYLVVGIDPLNIFRDVDYKKATGM